MPAMGGALGSVAPHWSQLSLLKSLVAPQAVSYTHLDVYKRQRYGFPTASIVDMGEVTEHLLNRECQGRVVIDDKVKAALDAYYEQYGAKR